MTRINAKPPFKYGYYEVMTPEDLGLPAPKPAKKETVTEAVKEPEVVPEPTPAPIEDQNQEPDTIEEQAQEEVQEATETVEEPVSEETVEEVVGTKLADAGFSSKSIRNLRYNGIKTVEQLEQKINDGDGIVSLPKIGEKSAETILKELEAYKNRG